ncbi:MAG: hypothetical protein ACTSPY_16415 [Candidatus Helarchaeota archaeon]
MSRKKPLIKCSKCGQDKFNTRLCTVYGAKRIICTDCCESIKKAGNCKVKACPFRNL